MTDTTTKFDPIPRLQQIAATIRERGGYTFDAPATAAYYIECSIKEIERLRQENATLTAERDALWRLTDRLYAEHDALRAERDEVRQSYCSLMEAYRGGNGMVTANKLGWGYLFEEDKPCQ